MTTKLLPGEHFRCLARPHWIVLARSLAWSPAPFLAALAAGVVLHRLPVAPGVAPLVPPALLLGLAISGGGAGVAYVSWANRFVLVTDLRAIQQSGLLRRRRSMVPLDRIQDVTTDRGPLGALLDFGDINVTTAGLRHPSLVLSRVRSPERVARALFGTHLPVESGMLDDHDGISQAVGAARLHGRRQIHRGAPGGGAGGHRVPRPRRVDRA